MKTIRKFGILLLCIFAVTAFFAFSRDEKEETGRNSEEGARGEVFIETFTVNAVQFKMVRVKGGTFQMGATSEQGSDAYDNEYPVHSLTLSDYYIGQTQVTQELWEAVMGNNSSYFKGDNQCPVENVNWNDCQEFIQKYCCPVKRKLMCSTSSRIMHGQSHI